MGAKDTLIDSRINGLEVDQQLLVSQMFEVQAAVTWDIAYKAGIVEGQSSEGHQKAILLAVKAARKDGMKEVVEWSDEKCPHDIQELSQSGLVTRNEMPEKKCECPLCWQAFLVEKELR